MSSLMVNAIDWVKIRRPVSNSAWIADRAALQKMLQLCSACLYKLPHRWQRQFHYAEMTALAGLGLCDGCRHEDVLKLYVSTDDPWFEQCERQAAAASAIQAADRAFAVTDRRRVF